MKINSPEDEEIQLKEKNQQTYLYYSFIVRILIFRYIE
jgi:hypothetical protein